MTNVTRNEMCTDFCGNANLPTNLRMGYNQGIKIIHDFLPVFIISGAYYHIGQAPGTSNIPGISEETRDALVLRKKKKVS